MGLPHRHPFAESWWAPSLPCSLGRKACTTHGKSILCEVACLLLRSIRICTSRAYPSHPTQSGCCLLHCLSEPDSSFQEKPAPPSQEFPSPPGCALTDLVNELASESVGLTLTEPTPLSQFLKPTLQGCAHWSSDLPTAMAKPFRVADKETQA